MTSNHTSGEEKDTGYSRKRLLYIAVAWFLIGVTMFAFLPTFSVAGQDAFNCENPPCQFPGENNIGGIVLASDFLQAYELITYGVWGGSPVTVEDHTAPGRVQSTEEGARIGANDVSASNFTIFKQWSYYDERVEEPVDVYIWADAPYATLNDGDSGNNNCGDGSSELTGSTGCDLIAGVGEIHTRYLYAEDTCDGVGCGILSRPVDANDLWIVRPENDDCPTLAAGLTGNVCFGLVDDDSESGTAAGTTVTTNWVQGEEYYHRTQNLRSVRGPSDNDKQVNIQDPYFEMRYGVGADRINVPTSRSDKGDWWGEGNFGEPTPTADGDYAEPDSPGATPEWGQPFNGSNGEAALGSGFTCAGGVFETQCTPPSETAFDSDGQSYDGVHKDPDEILDRDHFEDIEGGIRPEEEEE